MIEAIQALIVAAALAHGVSPDVMLNMAYCESTFRADVVSGPNVGLFQLSRDGKLREFTAWETAQGLPGHDPFDPARQSNFVAEQLTLGAGPAWSCWRGFRWQR